MSLVISPEQRAAYERDGYLVIRRLLSEDDLRRLDSAIDRHVPDSAYAPGRVYPESAKYTLSEQCPSDPDLAYIVEHPKVLDAAEELLGGAGHLTAYVVYLRTPGDGGSKAHNDYKRWRPVGSSMNWLFTVVPLTDFDSETGPLLVAPGSHQPELVVDRGEKTLHRGEPVLPPESQFVDAELRRGDLLLMNMYTWHWAPPNVSARNRVGIFNKYAAAAAPPAAGYFVNRNAVGEALSPAGRRLIAVASDRGVATTRLLLCRDGGSEPEVLVTRRSAGDDRFHLPGGPGWEEDVIPGWDVGNRIASLGEHASNQIGARFPWMSYVGDYDEGDGLARIYGYAARSLPIIEPGPGWEARWMPRSALDGPGSGQPGQLAAPYLTAAMDRWLDPTIVRGKGLTQAQSQLDQYAV